MKIAALSGLTVAVTAALGMILSTADATAAERGWRARNEARPAASVQRPRGDYTRTTTRQRTETGHTRSDVFTNPAGRTASRNAVVSNDHQNQTRTRDVLWSGPEGQSATRRDVTERTENGYRRRSDVNLPDGRTATRDAVVTRDAEAGLTERSIIATGPNGQTRHIEEQRRRTEDGYMRHTDITRADGGVVSRDVDANFDRDTRTWTREVSVDRPDSP